MYFIVLWYLFIFQQHVQSNGIIVFVLEAPQQAKKPRVEPVAAPVNLDADDPIDDDEVWSAKL